MRNRKNVHVEFVLRKAENESMINRSTDDAVDLQYFYLLENTILLRWIDN